MQALKVMIVFLAVGSAGRALADDSIKIEIARTAGEIRDLSIDSKASFEKLSEAKVLLGKVRKLLIDSSSSSDNSYSSECFKFAFSVYNRSKPSTQAAEKASLGCKGFVDVKVIQYLFDIYNRSLVSSDALDRSLRHRPKQDSIDLELLKLVFETYNRSLTSVDAADRAVVGVARLPLAESAKACVLDSFSIFNRTMASSDAMDKALASCKN